MHSGEFRLPKYCRRCEYVSFNLDNPIPAVGAVGLQQQNTYRFTVDSSGDTAPLDWYNAYFEIEYNVGINVKGGAALTAADEVAMINGSHSLINKLQVNFSSVNVLDSQDCNLATHVKNLVDYSKGYSDNIAQSMFFYPDTSDQPISKEFVIIAEAGAVAPAHAPARTNGYNEGFAKRKTLLNAGSKVNCVIPLNRYGFFESLYDHICPNGKCVITPVLESDDNISYRGTAAANTCRYIISKFILWVPKMIFNSLGNEVFLNSF